MSKTRKIISVFLVVSVIGLVLQIVDMIHNPGFSPAIVPTSIIPIGLCISLLSSKKNDDDKK